MDQIERLLDPWFSSDAFALVLFAGILFQALHCFVLYRTMQAVPSDCRPVPASTAWLSVWPSVFVISPFTLLLAPFRFIDWLFPVLLWAGVLWQLIFSFLLSIGIRKAQAQRQRAGNGALWVSCLLGILWIFFLLPGSPRSALFPACAVWIMHAWKITADRKRLSAV